MSIILPNLNHSFISPVPFPVPDPDFGVFHTPIMAVVFNFEFTSCKQLRNVFNL